MSVKKNRWRRMRMYLVILQDMRGFTQQDGNLEIHIRQHQNIIWNT